MMYQEKQLHAVRYAREHQIMKGNGRTPDTAAALQGARPLPTPDLTATNVFDAYPLANLVFPSPYTSTLTAMPASEWRTVISEGKTVQTTSRYVASRIANLTQAANAHPSPDSPQTIHLQLLRYLLLLIEFSRAISKFRAGKSFLPIHKWPPSRISDHAQLPSPLLHALIQKYCPDGTGPTKSNLILLHTTILAITLHLPPPSGNPGAAVLITDPNDVQQDLGLTPEDTRRYLRELGCKMETASEQELKTWGVRKPGEKEVRIKYAKLRVPLVFPKMGRGPPARGR